MKEWLKVSRSANGTVVVTVTLAEENLSARWSVKCFRGAIVGAVREARKAAFTCLDELREAAE